MLTYKAFFARVEDEWVHTHLLDFPGVVTCGRTDAEARDLLADALVLMSEALLEEGRPLPPPDPAAALDDPEGDFAGLEEGATWEEPIHLIITAGSRLAIAPRVAA